MSYKDYKDGQKLELEVLEGTHTYNGVIQALIRMYHDPSILKSIFPEVHADLLARYHAQGGLLPGEDFEESVR